jgi:hypothetical protein
MSLAQDGLYLSMEGSYAYSSIVGIRTLLCPNNNALPTLAPSVNDPYDITLNPYQLSQVKGYKFVL